MHTVFYMYVEGGESLVGFVQLAFHELVSKFGDIMCDTYQIVCCSTIVSSPSLSSNSLFSM